MTNKESRSQVVAAPVGSGRYCKPALLALKPLGAAAHGAAQGSAMHISVGTEPHDAAREVVTGTETGREACKGALQLQGLQEWPLGPPRPVQARFARCAAHRHAELAGRLPGPEPLPL